MDTTFSISSCPEKEKNMGWEAYLFFAVPIKNKVSVYLRELQIKLEDSNDEK